MESIYLREQKRYSQSELVSLFNCSEEKTVKTLKRLKEYGVLKAVTISDVQKELTDLMDDDIEIADVEIGENEYMYVFTFVGVIIVNGFVLKCYPKYLLDAVEPFEELKQVIEVLHKYNSKEQIIRMYNETNDSSAFNLLAVMLFFFQDYYEYGVYSNTQDIIETNGSGEILWDRTINETFTLLSNNRPYYPEMCTKRQINDDFDYFKRLHECILSLCSKELEKNELLDIFGITSIDLSDEQLDDFGDKEYILDKISKEINVQFNTRKQRLLKTMYAYISNSAALDTTDCFSLFGTNSFNLVWEKVCADVLDNQLQTPLGALKLPVPLTNEYQDKKQDKLIQLIDKPHWHGLSKKGEPFSKTSEDTLIPDIITIAQIDGKHHFIIFDAKYYNIQFNEHKLRGQPGIESITKQYLYQLAYQEFIVAHGIDAVENCFLMPTSAGNIKNIGAVSLKMMEVLPFLQEIQIVLLPAKEIFDYYIKNQKMKIDGSIFERKPIN